MLAILLHPLASRRHHAPAPPRHIDTSPRIDAAAQRHREAGGPVDRASYACPCGFVFAASVSTSVRCPHCGAHQAW
jgi:hypothetical protein